LSFEEGTVTLAPGTDGVLRMTFSSTLDVAAGLTATVQTPIAEDTTARSLVKRGEGTLVLSGDNTYTGMTIVDEGALVLSGSPTGQSNTTVNGSTLKLDYSSNDTGKIHDSAVLTLGGGTLELAGGSHTEVVASTTIAVGLSSVTRSSGSATLVMNTMTPGPGIVDFAAPDIATTDNTNTNGILGPWATVGNGDWAQNSTDADDGPITAYTGYTDIAATGDTITDGSTTNVRLNSAGAGGNLALSADTTAVNTLLQNTTTAATVETASKALQAGGMMIGTGQEALTIGAAAGDGTLTGASAGGVLYLNNTNAAKTLTVNAVIADNTSPSALAAAGNVLLQGVNTYTGATYVNAGTLEIGGAGQLAGGTYSANIAIARGATFKYNSSADQMLSGSISGSGGLLKDAAGALTLSGANTYTGATTISGGALRIGDGGGTGSLSTSSAITNNATLVFNKSNVITQGLDFAYGISGSGDVTQAGAGTLVLSGANAYTGMTTVSAGTLVPSATSSLPGYDSAGKVVFDGGTVRLPVGGSGWTTADVDTLLANATRNSGALGIDTSNGDLTQWAAFTPANLGTLSLIKVGENTLTLDQANTHTGTTTVNAGTLIVDGSINDSDVTVNAGATFGGSGSVKSLTMNANTIYQWGMRWGAFDMIAVNGDLDLAGAWTLKLLDEGGYVANDTDKLDLFSYTGALTNSLGTVSYDDTDLTDDIGETWNIGDLAVNFEANRDGSGINYVYLTGLSGGGLPFYGTLKWAAGADGVWGEDDTDNWELDGPWIGLPGAEPNFPDDPMVVAVVDTPYSVTVQDANRQAFSLTVSNDGTVAVAAGRTLAITTDVEVQDGGTLDVDGTLTADSTAVSGGALNVNAGAAASLGRLTVSDGSVNLAEDVQAENVAFTGGTLDTGDKAIVLSGTLQAAGVVVTSDAESFQAMGSGQPGEVTVGMTEDGSTTMVTPSAGPGGTLNAPDVSFQSSTGLAVLHFDADAAVVGDLSFAADGGIYLSGAPDVSVRNLAGTGLLVGSPSVRGAVQPGAVPGLMQVFGSVTLEPGAALQPQVQGPDSLGMLYVDEVLDLDAANDALAPSWLPGSDASSMFGGEYVVVDAFEKTVGEFDIRGGGNIGSAYIANVAYNVDIEGSDGKGVKVTLHDQLAGDVDLDGEVARGDLLALRSAFGSTDADWLGGDLTFDGDVNYLDYIALKRSMGDSVPGGAGAVPEPATLALLALGALGALTRRRRRTAK